MVRGVCVCGGVVVVCGAGEGGVGWFMCLVWL